MTDEELVRAVLDGNQERIAELVQRYQARLVNYLYRLVRNSDDAHDLAQEVFVRVYQALDRFDPSYRFSTWLFRVAGNAAIDHLRRRRGRTISLDLPPDEEGESRAIDPRDEAPDPHEALRRQRLRHAIDEAIRKLPDDYRELISLRHYGDLPYEEIAELKRLPLGTVKNKFFRARQALRDLLPPDAV